jgi:ADP-ribosylglycohydrolase
MGKNCGGTLGAPLEKTYGEPEPFDVWWYPEIREGGIPNDDLEMQLIWLKALEEIGPKLTAENLTQYWLDYIGYNWDEYGLSKTNFRMGLLPPVASSYNNWFKDCMGCPIRSEIWACVAPGAPRIAVRLAYEDAICDHAGGESVYGEMFNTAIEAAAFVVDDIETLLDIGRSYVADGSKTAIAVDAARQAHRDGLDWKAARLRVLEATPNYNAQYSPLNMAFQVIGLLYAKDFGEGICIAVNCGYDTDCTGATVGSMLGILAGAKGLPAKWTEPLGSVIATNEAWGGLIGASAQPNAVPTNLDDLTTRTLAQTARVMAAFSEIGVAKTIEDLYADDGIRALWTAPTSVVTYPSTTVSVTVDYLESPTIKPGASKKVVTTITNERHSVLSGVAKLAAPVGWMVEPVEAPLALDAYGSVSLEWLVRATADQIENTNQLSLSVALDLRIAERSFPVVLIGERALRVSGPYPVGNGLEGAHAPETVTGAINTATRRGGNWTTFYAPGNDVPVGQLLDAPGTVYVQTFYYSDRDRDARIGVPATCPTKLWLNGEVVKTCPAGRRLRPNYNTDGESYADKRLVKGWNEVLVKYTRTEGDAPFEGHLILCESDKLCPAILDVGWTRLPW